VSVPQILLLVLAGLVVATVWIYRARLQAAWARARKFLAEVKAEMRKVTWPTRDEVIGSTIVVIASVVALAIFIGIEDRILAFVLQVFISS